MVPAPSFRQTPAQHPATAIPIPKAAATFFFAALKIATNLLKIPYFLVGHVLFFPVNRFAPGRLCLAFKDTIFNYKVIHFCAHHAGIGFFGCANYGFAAHIEAGINYNAISTLRFYRLQ